MLLYLARSYYENNQLPESKKTLERALFLVPENALLWYSLGIVQQEMAYSSFEKKNRVAEDLEIANLEFKRAASVFRYVSKLKVGNLIDPKKVSSHEYYCSGCVATTQQALDSALKDRAVRYQNAAKEAESNAVQAIVDPQLRLKDAAVKELTEGEVVIKENGSKIFADLLSAAQKAHEVANAETKGFIEASIFAADGDFDEQIGGHLSMIKNYVPVASTQ